MPVHLYGQAADLDPIVELCQRHGLRLVEDCAQSYGARYGGRMTGAFGDFGCFSFYPSKNLGAFGDGGMVTTNDEALAAEVRVYRNHGSRVRYHHHVIGYNSRLDEIQAVILRVKLQHLEDFNTRRRAIAHAYNERLAGCVVTPVEAPNRVHVYHQYTMRSPRRDAIQKALGEAGIGSMIYYPVPLHRQEVYADLLPWREPAGVGSGGAGGGLAAHLSADDPRSGGPRVRGRPRRRDRAERALDRTHSSDGPGRSGGRDSGADVSIGPFAIIESRRRDRRRLPHRRPRRHPPLHDARSRAAASAEHVTLGGEPQDVSFTTR